MGGGAQAATARFAEAPALGPAWLTAFLFESEMALPSKAKAPALYVSLDFAVVVIDGMTPSSHFSRFTSYVPSETLLSDRTIDP